MKFKGLNAVFYKSGTGNEPVRAWLQSLSKEDKKILGEDIKTVQLGWPLGMPLVRSLGDSLWEVRSSLETNRIARVVFFMHDNSIILLHGFIKKSQKTPQTDIDLAKKRMKEVKQNG
ncbi:MAG: type II toxin-antitoxin system RelE/ParE family toxin [Gammaproteobacteria bacterium]|nr:type II toxin-antitoxin system RelE/ParE family toxin [Gammaproteobacteria bacterium]